MNKEWLERFKQWNAFSKFIMEIELLQIIIVITAVISFIVMILGGLLSAITAHNTGGQITWLLTSGTVIFKLFLLQMTAVIVLFLMKLPFGIVNFINYAKDEWNDVMRKYKREVSKYKKEIDKNE